MPATFSRVDPEVLDLAQELIDAYHPWLLNFRIGLLFRSERMTMGDNYVFGEASKVSPKLNALLPEEERLDFMIWLAEDFWHDAHDEERRALLDHELCHCGPDGKLRRHDIGEFVVIIKRHGLWYPALQRAAEAMEQHELPGILEASNGRGAVVSIELNGENVFALSEESG